MNIRYIAPADVGSEKQKRRLKQLTNKRKLVIEIEAKKRKGSKGEVKGLARHRGIKVSYRIINRKR